MRMQLDVAEKLAFQQRHVELSLRCLHTVVSVKSHALRGGEMIGMV